MINARHPHKHLGVAGQSCVEAALLLPVFLVGLLLVVQPCIILFDTLSMRNAALQGCRVAMTLPAQEHDTQVVPYVLRRLGNVPQTDWFHLHQDDECSWSVSVEGDESSETVRVSITNKLVLLPLIGFAGDCLGISEDGGVFTVNVSIEEPVEPAWVYDAVPGSDPAKWVRAWLEE